MKSTYSFVTLFPALLKVNLSKPPSKMSLKSLTQLIRTSMKAVKKRKFIISLLLLSGVLFTFIFKALVSKDPYLTTVKDLQDQKASQTGLLNKNNNSLALKMEALTASPSKEQAIPHKTYLISQERCTQKVFLLIMVPTHPASFDRRSAIRKTWGTDPSMKTRWKTVFLLGQVATNIVQNDKHLEAEGMMHRDLIRGAQKEHYYNLTLKTQMGLEWASKYCDFQYLLKADDDVFVNPYLLTDYLRKPVTPKTKLYTGRCRHDAIPLRKGKYKVSREEYNRTRYPAYCLGAYLLSSDLVHKLVEMFDVCKEPFKMEDVYIGMLIEKMGDVEAKDHGSFHHDRRCHLSRNVFAQHLSSAKCMGKLFNLAMKTEGNNTER